MCSVNDIEDGMRIDVEKQQKAANLHMCMKCGGKSVLLVRARDPMCKVCFINYFTHKFRATLGKSKAIRQGEKVLIAFSGGASSCSMLQLIKEGLSQNAHKKLRFWPEVVFINESLIHGWSDDRKASNIHNVVQFSQKLGFEISIIDIEKIFTDLPEKSAYNWKGSCICSRKQKGSDSNESSSCLESSDIDLAKEKLKRSFQNAKSLTAKQDLLYSLRARLLRDFAKEKNCTKILVSENATRLSIKLLLNIAEGRGGSLPYDIGVSDNRDDQVGIIRPMRELTAKEVAFYNRLYDIEPIVSESLDTMLASKASLQKQTEAFVTNLQASFPSTVSTIFRTGDKLTVSDDLISAAEHCVVCQIPLSEREAPRGAGNLSGKFTTAEKNGESVDSNCCGKGDTSCESNSKYSFPSAQSSDVIQRLCYGCRLTFRDMGDCVEDLPPYVIGECESLNRRSKMRDAIQDFLLD